MEPKKQKLNQIKCILSSEFIDDIPLTKVYVSQLEDKKWISKAMLELSKKCPLEDLQHLKRVRNNEIMICGLEEDLNAFLKAKGISEDLVAILTKQTLVKEVPSKPTVLRWQFEIMNKLWPCKFHPDKYLESLYENTNFSQKQINFHLKISDILNCFELLYETDYGVCVDPRDERIVAVTRGCSNKNPVLHCPMVLIDHVARTQGSGVWSYEWEFHEEFNGVPKELFEKINQKYNNLLFGAEKAVISCEDGDNLAKFGPYLCTGYDIYLNKEPCLMCSMALVHSRAKRIFFCKQNTANGALMSKIKLHTIKDLNHHFEVFWIQ